MKLIFAIVNNDDGAIVSAQLIKQGIHVTKMASTGGFLKKGNHTFITAVEDDEVEKVIDIIREQGFEGIAITDALNMMGVVAKYGGIPAEIIYTVDGSLLNAQ